MTQVVTIRILTYMRIKYRTIEDDYIAFSIFYSRHSPLAKRSRITAGVIILVVFIVFVLLQAIYTHDLIYAFIVDILLGCLVLFLVLMGKNERVIHFARETFKEGKNKGFLGIHELEVNDYGIQTKSEYGEGKIAWDAIERIGSTPDYTFIFIGANIAIPLPKARILEGDYDAFVKELTSGFMKSPSMASISLESKQANILIDPKPVSCEDKRAGRHSGYGIASFVIALASIGAIILAFTAAVIAAIMFEGTTGKDIPLFITGVIGILFSWCATFAGVGLGILGLLSKNRKKTFAVIGLILNLLIIFSAAIIMVITRCGS